MLKYLFGIVLLFSSISCSDSEGLPLEEPEPRFNFEGMWLGSWSDSLFPALSVSAIVQKLSADGYSGSFFYRQNTPGPYMPCCGGATDGVMSFETKGDSVINFVYRQDAPNYKGGCPGTYTGSGALDKVQNRLIIKFNGEDCDGFHNNGLIFWRLDK